MAYSTDTTITVKHSCGHIAAYKARGNLDPKKIEIALKHIGPTICPACESHFSKLQDRRYKDDNR